MSRFDKRPSAHPFANSIAFGAGANLDERVLESARARIHCRSRNAGQPAAASANVNHMPTSSPYLPPTSRTNRNGTSAPGSGQGNVYFSRALTEDIIGEIAKGLEFDSLGRAALPGQLHRFSRETARNFKGEIVTTQLIVRVGRTVTGNVYPFADVVKGGKPILIIARPNMRKTTTLRELVRVVKGFFPNMTVELVDRSSEIGGAGYHGHASLHSDVQRIQLNDRTPGETATITYRNYSPNFLIYDEVADREEAEALMKARNAGVVVVATTHGDLQTFVESKSLRVLSGNTERSIVSDDTAMRGRGSMNKVRRDRSTDPGFDALNEMDRLNNWCIHRDFAAAIDSLLHREDLNFERARSTKTECWLHGRRFACSSMGACIELTEEMGGKVTVTGEGGGKPLVVADLHVHTRFAQGPTCASEPGRREYHEVADCEQRRTAMSNFHNYSNSRKNPDPALWLNDPDQVRKAGDLLMQEFSQAVWTIWNWRKPLRRLEKWRETDLPLRRWASMPECPP
ncbi:Uncharacterized protein HDU89_002591 [Geranomyces variabilis]|nr:Uncharacterized protein HDU89_002591 [Geranomyces variabilis]